MDMQTKIIFHSSYSKSTYRTPPYEVLIDDNTPENLGDIGGEFREYYELKVFFDSTEPNAILEVDNITNDEIVRIKVGEEYILTHEQDHDEMLTPGDYGFRVITNKKTYEGLYFINPSTLSWDDIINLRKYMESYVKGLSKNLYIQRMTRQNDKLLDIDYYLYDIYECLMKYNEIALINIESIIKNPIMDIKKEYKEQAYSVRPDIKSERWLQKKGISRNQNINKPEVVYEKHAVLNYHIVENKWIKKIINKVIYIICDLEYRFGNILSQKQAKYEFISNTLAQLSAENLKIQRDFAVGKHYKYTTAKQIEFTKKNLENIEYQIECISQIIYSVTKIKIGFLHYFHQTWLYEIPNFESAIKPTNKMFKDKRYLQLYELYGKLQSIEKSDLESRKISFPSKKTSKLFEYYAVIETIFILRENGFDWQKGWLASDFNTELYNGELPSGEKMIFEKENLRCELVYEKQVQPDTVIQQRGESDFVRINAHHYEPDILVSIYDINTGELLRAFIIEVKCNRKRSIQSNNGPTKVIEQVKEYYGFGYYNVNAPKYKKTRRAAINGVIVVYPKQDIEAKYTGDDLYIPFVQVAPNESTDITTHYGFVELKKEIDKHINACLGFEEDDEYVDVQE